MSKPSKSAFDWNLHFRKVSRPTADFGAEGNPSIIKQVQHDLNLLGASPPLVEDGIWGPKSAATLKQFQQVNGLTVDGVIGAQVLKALGLSSTGTSTGSPLPIIPGPSIDGIKQAVIDAFTGYSRTLEGSGTNFMYTDNKGYVTTGTGNLIDPIGSALGLAWKQPDGSLASQQEIANAWNTVKAAWPAVQSYASQSLTSLRLDSTGMAELIARQLKANHDVLRTQFPGYVNWPADGQLGIHSISWAWGSRFADVWDRMGGWGTQFKAALNQPKPDFLKAADIMTAASQHEETINSGIIPRDADQRVLFKNAADAQAKRASYDKLFYPNQVVVALAGIGAIFFGIVGGVLAFIGYTNYNKTGKLW
jgi:peptidoglycan hydrolase-like protein with peptidoglycan-binding domain